MKHIYTFLKFSPFEINLSYGYIAKHLTCIVTNMQHTFKFKTEYKNNKNMERGGRIQITSKWPWRVPLTKPKVALLCPRRPTLLLLSLTTKETWRGSMTQGRSSLTQIQNLVPTSIEVLGSTNAQFRAKCLQIKEVRTKTERRRVRRVREREREWEMGHLTSMFGELSWHCGRFGDQSRVEFESGWGRIHFWWASLCWRKIGVEKKPLGIWGRSWSLLICEH